jgi:protein gp37
MNKSPIEWTEVTWNPIRGCSRVSEGCRNCYAERDAARKNENPKVPGYRGFSRFVQIGGKQVPQWTGKVAFIESKLEEPLHWRKPARVFVNSMSDLFHEALPDEAIDRIFAVMAMCRQHTFQVLTKRPERMLKWATRTRGNHCIEALNVGTGRVISGSWIDPIENVWLGVSVEDQETADERIPLLLQTPATVRFVSYEPALAPVDFANVLMPDGDHLGAGLFNDGEDCGVDWIIVGGESGPGARTPNPAWFQRVRDDCAVAGVPFLFKQWGDWSPDKPANWIKTSSRKYSHETEAWDRNGEKYNPLNPPPDHFPSVMMYRVGKKSAGRLLDGREWNGMPAASI